MRDDRYEAQQRRERQQERIEGILNGLTGLIGYAFLVVIVFGALYLFIRFVKWAWEG